MNIDQSSLKEMLKYDEAQGSFTWIKRRGSARAGAIAGGPGTWGHRIWIMGRFYQAAHLVWLYHHGYLPSGQIDHIDRNPFNNRIENLREATQSQNKANSNAYKNNKLGIKGVRLHRNGRYEARIRKNGELIYLGCFQTIDDAKLAYNSAAMSLFGEFAALHE